LTVSCKGKTINNEINAAATDSIYTNVMDFKYDTTFQRAILLKGVINDSIKVDVYLETGWSKYIGISDSLRYLINGDSVVLNVGNWEKKKKVYFLPENFPIFSFLGNSNTVIINWQLFDNKIIEISYKYKQIRELKDSTCIGKDYSKIKIKKIEYTDVVNLCIPVKIYVQGKEILEYILIDTGYNGSFILSNRIKNKYAIDTKNARFFVGKNGGGEVRRFAIKSDSVKIGNFITANIYVSFSENNFTLLGNGILEQYNVIFDLINYNLYIKPN
jgi:predicted aspartyl protease